MKTKHLWGILGILLLLLATAFSPPIPEGPIPDQNTAPTGSQDNLTPDEVFLATILPIQGEVYWRQQAEQSWSTINNQHGLDTGNQILTKTEGRAKIEYFDGVIVRVGPHTLFTVSEQSQTGELNLISRIRLLMGQIFIKHGDGYYDGKFEVETPSGLAAVKGTMMSVQITADGQTLVTCLEGVCALSNELGEITLTEGQGASIESEGEAPQPAKIEDWQLNDWFENDPETINTALEQGLIDQVPASCNTATGEDCLPDTFNCNPLTGENCDGQSGCDPISGEGCISDNIIDPEAYINCVLNGTCSEEWSLPTIPEVPPLLPNRDEDQSDTVIEVLPDLPEDNILPDAAMPEVTLPEYPNCSGGFLENLLEGLQNLANLQELKNLHNFGN
jgi:FecR protein